MANGVETHRGKLRVYFTYNKEKCREPLGLPPNEDNIAYAERMVAQINHEINAGTFEYARYFPNSKRQLTNRLGHYINIWLDIKKNQVADSTYRGYRTCTDRIRSKFGDKQTHQIDYIEIEGWIANDLTRLSSKTIKETMFCLRQIFSLYRKRYPLALDPTMGIRVKLPDDDDPDPFTRDEISKLLNAHPRDNRIQELNFIKFLLWTGPRVSEGIALAMEDIVDLDKGIVHFRRSCVRGRFRCTKTKRSVREVELIKPAREALQAQIEIIKDLAPVTVDVTQRDNRTIKKENIRFVFLNSNTMRHHHSESTIRDRFFKAHCNLAGVRYRGTNQCRHTYISQMLTANMPHEWISKQTGTSVEMIRRRYGKWIQQDSDDMVSLAESRLKLI